MDELKTNLDDIIAGATFARGYLSTRNLTKEVGTECVIHYTEENAPQIILCDAFSIGKDHKLEKTNIRIEFCENEEDLAIYVDNKFLRSFPFDLYKNKTTYTAAVAMTVGKFAL